jgi:arylsulfatase A-like enzyme
MNIVLVIADTFRRDHLGLYGNKEIHTPNLDRLGEESVVFDRAHCCSFPTLLCRAEMFTGRFVFPYLDWGPLPQNEVLLSSTLDRAGYTCAMVTDNLPLCRPGYGYDRGFHNRIRIRGQWYDNFQPPTKDFQYPCPPELFQTPGGSPRIQQYLRNTSIRQGEEDCFAPQVVREAIHWLEQNHDKAPFFLYVDLFDPHQPWDPPQHYVDLYDKDGTGHNLIMPVGRNASDHRPEDLKRMRALYAGEVTMVDRHVGRLLHALDELGRRDDTVVVFLSDHGILLGEKGLVGKSSGHKKFFKGWPQYSHIARVPMLFRAPGVKPGRRSTFVHPGDVGPTLLDLVGVKVPDTMRTRSLARVLRGQEEKVRDVSVSSWALGGFSPFRPSMIRSDEWAMAFWRSGVEPELYHLPSDPNEEHNVYRQHQAAARDLHRQYVRFLRDNETPARNLLPRSWLVHWGSQDKDGLLGSPGDEVD